MEQDVIIRPEEILSFWIDQTGEAGWYRQSDALDAEIRRRYLDLWEEARTNGLGWAPNPKSASRKGTPLKVMPPMMTMAIAADTII